MAIKSTKKVLASILSLAMISQPFCGAIKNFMENKVDPRKSSVVKKLNSKLLEKFICYDLIIPFYKQIIKCF